MWATVQDSITQVNDNPIGAVNAGMDKVMGPSFDYLQSIQSPAAKGVSSDGSFDQVYTNINAVSSYVDTLIVGPKVGSQFFTDSGGYCKAPGGGIVKRSTYHNNYLGADDAAGILGPSFQNAVAGSGIDGIIPGMAGDLASMNPLKLMNGLVVDGIPPCKAFTCPVVDTNGGINTADTRFLTPQLELNLGTCKVSENQAAYEGPAAKIVNDENAARLKASSTRTETFTDYHPDVKFFQPQEMASDPMAYTLWAVALACVVGYIAVQ